jgi:ABC-type uncharacterized transport system permease subunit
MQQLQKFALAIVLITLFASCQSTSDPKQLLSNKETRKETIETITNSNEMMNEMMEAILNNNNAKMVMQKNDKMIVMMLENRDTMIKVMKDNPVMMQNMMSDMMEACKNDTSLMSGMCKTMMGNQPMMDMMQKMKGEKMDGMKHKM